MKADFEYIINPDGTCHQWDCGKRGVVLAYDDFSPEGALWFCTECWQAYEQGDVAFLTVVEDRRIRNKTEGATNEYRTTGNTATA